MNKRTKAPKGKPKAAISRASITRGAMSKNGAKRGAPILPQQRTYSIPDYRLEKPSFSVRQVRKAEECCYEVSGDLSAPVPPIRDSKYLSKQQCIEIYRWMALNRSEERRVGKEWSRKR